jgi:hypothetical protein
MRVTQQAAGFAKLLQKLGADDFLVKFNPSASARRRCPGLPAELVCRLIRYQQPGFRPSWLLTLLLSPDLASRDELVELYHRRWSIETIYREWKHGLNIQNLRSHSPRGILKEVHAQLILSNLVRWIMSEATATHPATPVDLSFLTALTLVKDALPSLLSSAGPCNRSRYEPLLLSIRAARIRKRPGRSYPRPGDGKNKDKGGGRYQLPARLEKIA